MPIFIAALVGGLISAAGSFVGRVLIALGIGFVTYTGVDITMTFIKDFIVTNLQALPADYIAILGVLKVGTGINILASSLLARLTLNGLTSGTLKRMVHK